MKTWASLIEYQQNAGTILRNSYNAGRFSHAYIFEGPDGTRKKQTAHFLSKVLLCQNKTGDNDPCGVCHDCERIDDGVHPNVFYIKAKGKQIRKQQIRDLLEEFAKTAVEDKPRVYLVDEAERMNAESANTLLKTLEEPHADIYAFLLTDAYHQILPTIASRAQHLHFSPLDKTLIEKELIKKDIPKDIAGFVKELTGRVGYALKLARSEGIKTMVSFVKEIHHSFTDKNKSGLLLYKKKSDWLLKQAKTTEYFLMAMIFYEKDMLNCRLQREDHLIFSDERDFMVSMAGKIPQKRLEANLEKMLSLKNKLRYNINSTLAFDELIAFLERGFKHGS